MTEWTSNHERDTEASELRNGGEGIARGKGIDPRAKKPELPEDFPTRDQLLDIVKHWHKEYLDDLWFSFVYSYSGDWKRRAYACEQINRVSDLIGESAVGDTVRVAEEEFSKTVDPVEWTVFKHGGPEAWKQIQDRVQAEIDGRFGGRHGSQPPSGANPDGGGF